VRTHLAALSPSLEILRDESRRTIFDAIGDSPDLTYFTGIGNVGDTLIQAGNARLLEPLRPRRAPLFEIPFLRGHTAVLSGGGAWCAPYHEIMPHALREAERRFERVVVLPSSFDLSVPAVRAALAGTAARVIAREPESFRQIRTVCSAALALDGAFFFDFDPYRRGGEGVLNAYRTDREAAEGMALPADNDDISVTCRTLDAWIETIARHEIVRTDRAHVMIAAALLGKRVEYRPSAYHKLPAIADYALGGFPVVRSEPTPAPLHFSHPPSDADFERETLRRRIRVRALADGIEERAAAGTPPRVTVVLLSWNRREAVSRALASLRENVRLPWRLCVVDNGSEPDVAAAVAAEARAIPGAEIHLLAANRGCAGGRAFAVGLATTEYVLFLDDDAEVFPGTVERLVAALDSHPESAAATAQVVLPDGSVHHFGGRTVEDGPIVRFLLEDAGRPFDEPLGRDEECDWVPGTCALFRRSALLADPIDTEMRAYFEDNEWCFRAGRGRRGAFRRVHGSLALHSHRPKVPVAGSASPSDLVEFVQAVSRFARRHGKILDILFHLVPELRRADGSPDVTSSRLFLETAERDGADAFVLRWTGAGLAPLLHNDTESVALRKELASSRVREAELAGTLASSRAREAELESALAAFSGSRFGRFASSYWRLRAALARLRRE
jgi:GT2 family glycosyltransferase